jgi:glycosyltransferase involved in cell wall biosynthesis
MTEDVVAVISNSDVGYYPLRNAFPFKKIHFYHGTYRGQSEAVRSFISYSGYLYLKWWSSMVLERLSGSRKLVLVNSEQVRDEVKRFFGQEATTVWLPIDLERFKPEDQSASRKALRLPTDKVVALFAGSVHPMKGLPLIRLLMDRLPGVHWVLALRGDLPNDEGARNNLTVLRNVSPEQIPTLYSAADFCVFPSLYEPFGYVVAEALACGTPVIASRGGASQLFLREPPLSRLLISDPEALDEFVSAACEVMRDPQLYRRAVLGEVRPQLAKIMGGENWWARFFEVTGL